MRSILKQKLLWIAALGYFVDLYDLVLYGAVRVESLKDLGYQGADIFRVGADLLNIQMLGMLAGGVFFGIYGDKRGRMESLFASILTYSTATFLNAYANDFNTYASLRFIAGFGLAGELGAAITLVSEALPQNIRGMGSAWVASIGFLGAACSSYFSQSLSWQNAYRVGGALGFLLLAMRINVREPRMYLEMKAAHPKASWGSLSSLFSETSRLKTVVYAFLVGVPIWYVAGILSYFSPEFASELRITGPVTAGTTIMVGYLGSILGDLACGVLSQMLQSRKIAILIFLVLGGLVALLHPLFSYDQSPSFFYAGRFAIGFGCGFFAILIAWIAELFGTNLRVTATSLLANLIRASVIPLTLGFQALTPELGLLQASAIIGTFSFIIAILAWHKLPETFHRPLNYLAN